MQRYFFPCIGITPKFEQPSVVAGEWSVERRLWDTTVFDLATLASSHRLHLSWHLMEAFLSSAHCEISVSTDHYEAGRERARLFQAMLYLEGLSPFLMPFGATHSVNAYSGINNRDSKFRLEQLPEDLREGLTSDAGIVEVWGHEPALHCLRIPKRQGVTVEAINAAAEGALLWEELEDRQQRLKAVRLALQTAPMIPHVGSSLLHIWQGIESLFPDVRTEVSFRISLLVAQLSAESAPASETYKRAKASYTHRSNAAHGNLKRIGPDEWLEAWELLSLCMRAVRKRRTLPNEGDLISELLERR